MFKTTFPETSKKEIAQLEDQLSVQLPEDYINFMLNNNGGVFDSYEFSFNVNTNESSLLVNLDIMFGINTGNKNTDVELWTEKYSDDMFEASVIIADSIQHGFVVLVCSDDHKGVYYWDDTYYFKSSDDSSNTYFIANTFSDFLDAIHKTEQ